MGLTPGSVGHDLSLGLSKIFPLYDVTPAITSLPVRPDKFLFLKWVPVLNV